MKKARNIEELRSLYEEELARKDKLIEELRKENLVLMKMSVKSADERLRLKERVHELSKHHESHRER
ncbi:hypothetical protein GF367_00385 [Candidatus Woesearchaeota archaeon]|nr:hypothetical protein [Candidatus Woesearchaeota archaeon]